MRRHIEKGGIFIVVLVLSAVALSMIQPADALIGKAVSPFSSGCISGSYDCVADYLMYCEMGQWKTYKRCPHGCSDNICISGSDCTTGESRCLNEYMQECRDGMWINAKRCATGCADGKCMTGEQCEEGDFQCNNDYLQYCRNGVWFNKERCSSGCKDGACIGYYEKMSCKDTDDGKDFAVRGKVIGYDRHNEYYALTDTCVSDNELLEYFCNGEWQLEERHLCESGICRDGACAAAVEEPYAYEDKEDIVVQTIEPVIETIIPETKDPEKKGFFSALWGWIKEIFR